MKTLRHSVLPILLTASIMVSSLEADEITLGADAVRNMQLQFSQVKKRTICRPVQAAGTVRLNEKKVFEVTPKIDGTISEDSFSLGATIESGDILARIQSAELAEMITTYVSAEEEMRFSVAAAGQEKKLNEQNLSSAEQLRQAEMKVTEAVTAHARALQPLKLLEFNEGAIHQYLANVDGADYTSLDIIAPASGEIIEKDIRLGAAVDHDHSLFTIADLSELWVDFQVALKDAQSVSVGDEVEVESTVTSKLRKAKILYVAPYADEKSRTVMVRAILANNDRLWRPGTPVFVSATESSNAELSLTVPEAAVVDYGGGKAVFVKTGDNRFAPIPVKTGISDGSSTQILNGLDEGQTVVSRNAAQLKGHLEMTATE